MKTKYLYFAFVTAMFIGIWMGSGCLGMTKKGNASVDTGNATNTTNATEKTNKSIVLSKEELGNKTLNYINAKILIPQGVIGELASIEEYGEYLYAVNLIARVGEQSQMLPPIYVTKDGKMILIGQGGGTIDITEQEETPRASIGADDDPYLGPVDAKVTVIEFSDFECPYCSAVVGKHDALIAGLVSKDPSWEAPVPKLEELARQGKIKFVFRDYPLRERHPSAQKAAEAAQCANEQGKFWEMHDKLFGGQSQWSGGNATDIFKGYASELELNKTLFDACLDSGRYASEILKDMQDGTTAGVSGTPSFFVNGINVKGAVSFKVLERVINAELSGSTYNTGTNSS